MRLRLSFDPSSMTPTIAIFHREDAYLYGRFSSPYLRKEEPPALSGKRMHDWISSLFFEASHHLFDVVGHYEAQRQKGSASVPRTDDVKDCHIRTKASLVQAELAPFRSKNNV
ncbi:hypothetical protein AVEN_118897-1 [Araneus ventricosus]|uniref:Uncharacterized protein n=1 Tax=Araneus ventricosus TaxID=182803 RepID=A0A4Y2J4D8_ARAVE|nr:hypothetical protein AVEN_118897-1 [Araneus ventricosus]